MVEPKRGEGLTCAWLHNSGYPLKVFLTASLIAVLVLAPKILQKQTLSDDADKTVHSNFRKLKMLVDTLVLAVNPKFYKGGRSGSLAIAVLVLAPLKKPPYIQSL